MDESRFVYILTNEAMPSFVRVCFSPSSKAAALHHDAGLLPFPSKVSAQIRVDDLAKLEHALAIVFAAHRSAHAPEFYRVTAEQMCAVVELAAGGVGEQDDWPPPEGWPVETAQMANADGAAQAAALLSTIIAELMEDAHETAAVMPFKDAQPFAAKADQLAKVGREIAVLAQAMEVLSERMTIAQVCAGDERERIDGRIA
ncbi:MAG: hypothetical protein ACYDD1_14005 [Caulobacteraceae bacterium]